MLSSMGKLFNQPETGYCVFLNPFQTFHINGDYIIKGCVELQKEIENILGNEGSQKVILITKDEGFAK